MMNEVGAVVSLWALTVALAFGCGMFYNEYLDENKRECEQNLPRHMECVWSVPEGFENGD